MACALTLLRLNSLFVMIQNLGATRVDGGSPALDATTNDNLTEDFEDHPANDGDDESGSHCRCISGIEAIVEEHASLRGLVRKLAHSFRLFLVVSSLGCLGESFAFCFHVAVGDSSNGGIRVTHVEPTRGSERAETRAAHVGSRFEPSSRDARDAPDAKNGSLPVRETRSDNELPVTFE